MAQERSDQQKKTDLSPNSMACESKLAERKAAKDAPTEPMDSPLEQKASPALCCTLQNCPSAAPEARRKLQVLLMDTPAAFCDGLPRPMFTGSASDVPSKNSAGTFLQSVWILRRLIVTSISAVGSLLSSVGTSMRTIRTSQRWNWLSIHSAGAVLVGVRAALLAPAPPSWATGLSVGGRTAMTSTIVQTRNPFPQPRGPPTGVNNS